VLLLVLLTAHQVHSQSFATDCGGPCDTSLVCPPTVATFNTTVQIGYVVTCSGVPFGNSFEIFITGADIPPITLHFDHTVEGYRQELDVSLTEVGAHTIILDFESGSGCSNCSGCYSLNRSCNIAVPCTADSDCPGQWCLDSTGICQDTLPNGTPMPTVPGNSPTLDGTCSVAAGASVCASGVCDTDNKCGLSVSSGTECQGNPQCRNNVCNQFHHCSCLSDSDCDFGPPGQTCSAVGVCVANCAAPTSVPGVISCNTTTNSGSVCHESCAPGYQQTSPAGFSGADRLCTLGSFPRTLVCADLCSHCDVHATCTRKNLDTNTASPANWHKYVDCNCSRGWVGDGATCRAQQGNSNLGVSDVEVNACQDFPCAAGFICTDDPNPAANSAAGRSCSCPAGCQAAYASTGCKIPTKLKFTNTTRSTSNHMQLKVTISPRSPSSNPCSTPPTGTCTCRIPAVSQSAVTLAVHNGVCTTNAFAIGAKVHCIYSGDSIYLSSAK